MKHIIRTFIAMLTLLGLAGSAIGVECIPIAPKDVTGKITLVHPGASAATSLFEGNGCSWNGADAVNGLDGLILDVAGMGGTTGSATATVPNNGSLQLVALTAYYLDEGCAKVAGSDFDFGVTQSDSPESENVTIPEGAKWLVIAAGGSVTNDITVTLHSNGKDCPKVVPPKKKKKKR